MKKEKTNYEHMLILCKMFIKETNNLKMLINNLCEEFNAVSESIYFLNKHQNEILELLLNNFEIENIDYSPSFYHFMNYKKRK